MADLESLRDWGQRLHEEALEKLRHIRSNGDLNGKAAAVLAQADEKTRTGLYGIRDRIESEVVAGLAKDGP